MVAALPMEHQMDLAIFDLGNDLLRANIISASGREDGGTQRPLALDAITAMNNCIH